MHGGSVSAKACLYVLNDEDESIKAQYSFNVSVIFFCHSKRLIGAESNAERIAKYELKLLIFLKCFMILMNFSTKRSLSFASSCSNILLRAQYDILLKCSVNWFKFGINSSFCSFAQIKTSGIWKTKTY